MTSTRCGCSSSWDASWDTWKPVCPYCGGSGWREDIIPEGTFRPNTPLPLSTEED